VRPARGRGGEAPTPALPTAAEKPTYVKAMFGRIARRYDLLNTLMTGGQDARWRREVAAAARLPPGGLALDVGTGTAKLAQALASAMPGGRVVGVDFVPAMLLAGRRRLRGRPVALVVGDATRLPFADARFDAVASGFLVRNLADLAGGLREQARLVKPGGRLVVLEVTPRPTALVRPLFWLYFRGLVPLLGGLLAGDRAAYTYLPVSTAAFATPEHVAGLLRAAGLHDVAVRRLALGSVALISATR
jgi:demethylmenaquinone methyltransferase / 2-methoxy-6-polyprenyl-1,4-benzoquinol methylase